MDFLLCLALGKEGELIVRLHLGCVCSPCWDELCVGAPRSPVTPLAFARLWLTHTSPRWPGDMMERQCSRGPGFAGHAEVPAYWGFLGLLRGQRGGGQSSRSQSMARVVTVTAGALSWWFFCRTFVPLAGAGSGMPANGSSRPAMWFVSVTGLASSGDFGWCSQGPGGKRGARLPAELRVLLALHALGNSGSPWPGAGSLQGSVSRSVAFVLAVWLHVSSWMLMLNKRHLFSR